MIDPLFIQAELCAPPTVLGRKLRPLCAGHCLLLEAIESPYITGKGRHALGKLAAAVFICSRTYEQGRDAIQSGNLGSEAHKWGRAQRGTDLRAQDDLFGEYIETYLAGPELWVPGNRSTRDEGAPYPFRIAIAVATSMAGAITLSDAWNMGLNQVQCILATVADLAGTARIGQPGEREIKRYTPGAAPRPRLAVERKAAAVG